MVLFSHVSRKGNAIVDTIVIVLVLAVFAIGGIFGSQVLDELDTEIQADSDMTNTTKEVSSTLNSNYIPLMDNIFIFVFVMFTAFTVVSVFMLDSHPIFFIFSFILLIAVLIVSIFLGNAFEDIMSDPTITTYSNQFTYTNWVMSHLLLVVIGIAGMVLTALYIKFKG